MGSTGKSIGAAFALILASGALAHPPGDVLRLDADGDGVVSREEFRSGAGRGPRMFERADADGDGQLRREEVETAVASGAEERAEQMRTRVLALFDEMDVDGSGVVTREELDDHAFARIDADGDGRITADEAEALRERFRDRGERRHAPQQPLS